MQTAAETLQQSVITGRIRDALRVIGYRVPNGCGLATPQDLATMAPIIVQFTQRLGPEFAKRLAKKKNALSRAKLVAEAAEALAGRQPHAEQFPSVMKTVSTIAAGFVAYRSVKRRAGGRMEDIKLGDLMSLLGGMATHR